MLLNGQMYGLRVSRQSGSMVTSRLIVPDEGLKSLVRLGEVLLPLRINSHMADRLGDRVAFRLGRNRMIDIHPSGLRRLLA